MEKKVWYVAGASKGLGLALTHKLLTHGYRVAASSRLLPCLIEATGGKTLESFLPLEVDLADERSVADSFQAAWKTFGQIDVVVNNAGLSAGTDTVIPSAMLWLHGQGHGHIIDIAPATSVDAGEEIRHTTVLLGAFRTRFLNGEAHTPQAMYVSIDGRQLADPKKAAAALIRLPLMAEPPAVLVLDSDAYRRSTTKMAEFDDQIELVSRRLCRIARS